MEKEVGIYFVVYKHQPLLSLGSIYFHFPLIQSSLKENLHFLFLSTFSLSFITKTHLRPPRISKQKGKKGVVHELGSCMGRDSRYITWLIGEPEGKGRAMDVWKSGKEYGRGLGA